MQIVVKSFEMSLNIVFLRVRHLITVVHQVPSGVQCKAATDVSGVLTGDPVVIQSNRCWTLEQARWARFIKGIHSSEKIRHRHRSSWNWNRVVRLLERLERCFVCSIVLQGLLSLLMLTVTTVHVV